MGKVAGKIEREMERFHLLDELDDETGSHAATNELLLEMVMALREAKQPRILDS